MCHDLSSTAAGRRLTRASSRPSPTCPPTSLTPPRTLWASACARTLPCGPPCTSCCATPGCGRRRCAGCAVGWVGVGVEVGRRCREGLRGTGRWAPCCWPVCGVRERLGWEAQDLASCFDPSCPLPQYMLCPCCPLLCCRGRALCWSGRCRWPVPRQLPLCLALLAHGLGRRLPCSRRPPLRWPSPSRSTPRMSHC